MRTPPPHETPVWDDEPWDAPPPLAGTATADVCVVGLGGSGLSALRRLTELGVAAVGIDAGAVGAGAAGRNGGFLLAGMAAFHHDVAAHVGTETAEALYRMTADELERIEAETPEAVTRTGSVRLAVDDAELDDCRVQEIFMRTAGLPVQPYDGEDGAGLLFPADRSLQPLRRCRLLAGGLRRDGVRLYEHTPAVRFDGTRVLTPNGSVDAGAVIVAVDGGLERLLPELGRRVRTARAQMLATAPDLPVRFPRPVYARYGWDYWQQLPDGRFALGGCRDVGGDAEWTAEQVPTSLVQSALDRILREQLGVRAAVTHRWAGAIAFTADKLPVLEQVRPGVWAAGAYSGTGNVVGALCARAAADLACGRHSVWEALLAQARSAAAAQGPSQG